MCSKGIYFPQVWQCVLKWNLRKANKYGLKRESVDGKHMPVLLFKTIIPRLVFWLKSTSKGLIIYSRKIKFSLVAASMLRRNFQLCVSTLDINLVPQWGDAFLLTKKVQNPAAWHHMDLNRIQWASNLVKPKKLFNTFATKSPTIFGAISFSLWWFVSGVSSMFLSYVVSGLKQIYITNFGNHLVIPHA